MIRRFNYTGRERIATDQVSIRLTPRSPLRSFEVQVSLGDKHLPPNAAVYLEAFEKTAIMRFGLGTVANISQPPEEDRQLVEFEGSDAFNFRVKVVDVSSYRGRILAESATIKPTFPEEREQKRRSLLPVRYCDIGEQVWKVEFPASTQDPMELLVNNRIPDRTAFVQSPEFASLAMPSVLREILVCVLVSENHRELDDSSDWKCNWLQFAKAFAGTGFPAEGDQEGAYEWVDGVVDSFCKKHRIYSRYSELLEPS
jgi:hypothetical protein